MKNISKSFCILIFLFFSLEYTNSQALQSGHGRLIKLTLIPDYLENIIQFDGIIDVGDPLKVLDLTDFPLIVKHQWKEKDSTIWNVNGVISGGSLIHDPVTNVYHLEIEQMQLQPNDKLDLIFPYVNLDYAEIQPPVDDPTPIDEISRQLTNFFSYSTADVGREIQRLDIPFTPITKKVDLVLVPLIGEALFGKTSGLRLTGEIHFESIQGFGEFSRYCQITPSRIKNGDYRMGHLLYDLDFPSYFGPDVLNPIYQYKPTITGLRSELTTCSFDKESGVGEVDAIFSGRVVNITQSDTSFPVELRGTDFPDGNYSFLPSLLFKGIPGYEIRLGKIILAPGDTLTISIPNVQVQADNLQPTPVTFDNTGSSNISYSGPMSFELSLPYIPQTQLYISQFPSIIRPSVSLLEEQLGSLFPFNKSKLTWAILGVGMILLLFSKSILKVKLFAPSGWLLISIGLFYGVRGSFGLLYVVTVYYLGVIIFPQLVKKNNTGAVRKTILSLVSIALIALAIYVDNKGTLFFRGLSEPELSPLTPLVLLILVSSVLLLFYGIPAKTKSFKPADLMVFVLFLLVLSLYDAFAKSLLALIILYAGCLYLKQRITQNLEGKSPQMNEKKIEIDLQRRWKLVIGSRIISVAIIVLMIFAVANELSSTFANEMQISLSPLLAPIVIPVLSFISVLLAFTSIALLFILIYPFLPTRIGYMKAIIFALFLFLVFLFGVGTDNRLIAALPNILVGRVIYYLSMPMLIGVYFDINVFMQKENKRITGEGRKKNTINFQTASIMYFKNLQGITSTLVGIISLVAPSVYAFLSNQPVIVTYFSLLEKLVLLPI